MRRHQAFLQAHGYLDSQGKPTTVGIWAARLRVDQPLLIAEGLRHECFPSREPTLLAAVIAALVYDRDTVRRRAQPRLAKPLEAALLKVVKPL
ncbi:MAG: hypothetical protein CSB33_05685 [Desulfobacterales bacterium]|nr:MAG: hypothetical protein CSB33_05685 [Desulfobacterales bacterium]